MKADEIRDGVSDWIPFLKVSDARWLGFVGQDLWTSDSFGRSRRVNLECPISLLPVLERGRRQVLEDLEGFKTDLSFMFQYTQDFSWIDSVAEYACRSPISEYWITLALKWMEEKESLTDSEIDILRELSRWRKAQKIQHHARRVLRKHPDGCPWNTRRVSGPTS